MDISKLKDKVQSEYAQGFEHVREERDRIKAILKKVLPKDIPDGEVKVNLLWRNIQLEKAIFLNDEIGVTYTSDEGIIGKEITRNANLVAKYDDVEQDLYNEREDIVEDNATKGVAVTVVDGWDDDEKQPLSDSIDPLSVIPDPKNWRGSKMRFIGFERKLSLDYIMESDAFINKEKIQQSATISEEMSDKERAEAEANGLEFITQQDGLIDVYDHFTSLNGKKYLSTWVAGRSILIRLIELEPLTKAEQKKPYKIKYPVDIHRRKPIKNSFFGASIATEILQYQDIISVLTNLQVIQARLAGLGPDKIIDSELGVDLDLLGEKKPGGRIIPADNIGGQSIAQSIYTDVAPNPSQFPTQVISELNQIADTTTGTGSLAFGMSPTGSQTKAEVQMLMQNTNTLLSYVANNYMRGQRDYWLTRYRSYVQNMPKTGTKTIALLDNGSEFSKSLKRDEFVAGGKVLVYIQSKAQEAVKSQQEFSKLLSVANLYLANIKSEYGKNTFLRKLGERLEIRNFIPEEHIIETTEEFKAKQKLPLLNRDIEVEPPVIGEDFNTYFNIYKQALDTPAKQKVMAVIIRLMKEKEQEVPEMPGETDAVTSNIAMQQVTSQNADANSAPSLADIK